MKLAVMQPYFLPYIGYYQLMALADVFVVYDNIKYTKKGWINRNRMLLNGQDVVFSLPLKKGSDSLDVVERELSPDFDRGTLLNRFREIYRQAPFFTPTFKLLERIVLCPETNLFEYLFRSLVEMNTHLGIDTKLILSSDVGIDHSLKSQDKVLALCKALEADTYINSIGGTELYDRFEFSKRGINLQFIKSRPFEYKQFGPGFVPWLSVVDVLMFNSLDSVKSCIHSNYELI